MDEIRPAVERRDLIDGLGKGLRVIEAFDDEHPRRTPSDVATATGISRTAARRYLLSLVHFGYAATDGRLFWLTPRVLRLGQSYLSAARLPRLVQPFIQRVAQQCGETVNAGVLDGHEVVYIARSTSHRLISIGHQIGARLPAHVASAGIAMLSSLEDDALADWMAHHEFTAFTGQTVTDIDRFRNQVLTARQLGYWISEQQLEPGLRALAIALQDRRGECPGALSISVQVQSMSAEQMVERLLPLLREAAQTLRVLL